MEEAKRADRDFFNSIAATWDQTRAHREDRLGELIRRTGMKQGQDVLDLGCGTGVLLPFIVQAVGASGSVVGVDVSDNMIDIATGKFAHLANVRTVRADIMEYEAERCVDHVTCLNFFPHVQEKEAFLKRALDRWLLPGGWLHIFHDLSRAEVNAIHGGCKAVQEDRLPPCEKVGALLVSAGFVSVSCSEDDTCFFVQGQKRTNR